MFCGGYIKMTEALYTQLIIQVDTILNHIDTKTILPKYEGPLMVYGPKWYDVKQKIFSITHTLMIWEM